MPCSSRYLTVGDERSLIFFLVFSFFWFSWMSFDSKVLNFSFEFQIQNSLLLHVLHWRISSGSLQRRSPASSPRSSAATWGDENRDFNLKQFARNRVDKANLAKQLKRLSPFEANKFDSLVSLSTGESTGQSLNWPQLKCGQQIVRSMRSHRIVWGMESLHWRPTESFAALPNRSKRSAEADLRLGEEKWTYNFVIALNERSVFNSIRRPTATL